MLPLTIADFPLMAVGLCVYRRTSSSAMLTAESAQVAADVAMRLNRDGLTAAPQPIHFTTNTTPAFHCEVDGPSHIIVTPIS